MCAIRQKFRTSSSGICLKRSSSSVMETRRRLLCASPSSAGLDSEEDANLREEDANLRKEEKRGALLHVTAIDCEKNSILIVLGVAAVAVAVVNIIGRPRGVVITRALPMAVAILVATGCLPTLYTRKYFNQTQQLCTIQQNPWRYGEGADVKGQTFLMVLATWL